MSLHRSSALNEYKGEIVWTSFGESPINWNLGGGKLSYIVGRCFECISFALYSHAISARTHIGKGTTFEHHGIGCVIHDKASIGTDCKIFQHVTIGAKWGKSDRDGVPVIGNHVQIGAGAVIIGNITVGNDVVIGANAVVINDIPDGAIAVGVPARIIQKKSEKT